MVPRTDIFSENFGLLKKKSYKTNNLFFFYVL